MKLKLQKKISFLLLLLYVVVALNYFIPVLTHHIFKEYIADEICVQKEVIENRCQGNCHLQKQLSENKEENIPSNSKTTNRIQSEFENIIHQINSKIILSKRERIYYSIKCKRLEYFTAPIKPPPKYTI